MSLAHDDSQLPSSSEETETTATSTTSMDEGTESSGHSSSQNQTREHHTMNPPQGSRNNDLVIPVPVPEGANLVQNNPNDEAYTVEDNREIATPPSHSEPREPTTKGQGRLGAAGPTLMTNNPNDEMVPVSDAEVISTPRAQPRRDNPRGEVLQNTSHDEAIPVSGPTSNAATPVAVRGGANAANRMVPEPDDDDESEEDEEDETVDGEHRAQGYAGQKPDAIDETFTGPTAASPNLQYNPANYAKVNAKASREMQELFTHIMDYQPFVAELPAKLRPFIPDYIPAIGDIDPFVKIPRPDEKPDGLGLYVVDEPAIPQSNPAVVLLELRATNARATGAAVEVVDSFEDAANRPEVIDRWISDLKKVQNKKALTTVNYQVPMPEIESLMQVWPRELEDLLNSDLQLPSPHIDLDIDQNFVLTSTFSMSDADTKGG